MAVGTLPNDAYVVTVSLKADLEQIKRANGTPPFWCDVATVDFPNYSPLDEQSWFPTNDTNALHLWISEDALIGEENANDLNPAARVLIIGTVQVATDGELQVELMKLKTDVRRVLIDNGSRDYPGVTGGIDAAYYTKEVRPFIYRYHATGVGSIVGLYDVFYHQPPSG